MDERLVLFCLDGLPVHVGDLIRVKSLGYSWILEGSVVLFDGARYEMLSWELEVIDEEG